MKLINSWKGVYSGKIAGILKMNDFSATFQKFTTIGRIGLFTEQRYMVSY